jgi:uncharacterized protein YdaU (DUF1376 family)
MSIPMGHTQVSAIDELPFMKDFPRDYLGETSHFSQGQHGAYSLLLRHYWMRGGVFNLDDKTFNKLARAETKKEKENVKFVLSSMFYKDTLGYHHKALDRQLKLTRQKIRAAYAKHAKYPQKQVAKRYAEPHANGDAEPYADIVADDDAFPFAEPYAEGDA